MTSFPLDIKRFPTRIGHLYSGCSPDSITLNFIRNNKFHIIWNLAKELKYLVNIESEYVPYVLFGDIADYSIPESNEYFTKQLNRVRAALIFEEKIFVHCLAGHGRTGMALACIKMQLDVCSPQEALDASYEHCSGPENEKQINFVKNFK